MDGAISPRIWVGGASAEALCVALRLLLYERADASS